MQKMIRGFEADIQVDLSKPVLSREDTLRYVREMEERKIQVV
jgi:predicted polyphosphate/ATP-dependent NAD kinase